MVVPVFAFQRECWISGPWVSQRVAKAGFKHVQHVEPSRIHRSGSAFDRHLWAVVASPWYQ